MPEGLKGLRIYQRAEVLADGVWDEVARRYEELMGKVAEPAPQLNAYIRTLERKAKEGRAKP